MIRVLEPDIREEDIKLVSQSLKDGWVSFHGPYYGKFAEAIEDFLGLRRIKKRVVLTSSGTTALQAALELAIRGKTRKNIEYVALPELTYVATLSAVKNTRALSFEIADVDIATWNIDRLVWEKDYIDSVVTVDLYGVPCRIPPSRKNIIEDSCESFGAKDKEGNFCGTRGNYGVFSFFANKIITTGEGGALVVNEEEYAEARNLVNQYPGGLNYDHSDLGFNYRMTHMSAVLGWSQMQRIHKNLAAKEEIFSYYRGQILKPIQYQLSSAECSYWASTFLFEDAKMRIKIEEALKKNEIEYRRVFKPMGAILKAKGAFRFNVGQNAQDIYERGLTLPSSVTLKEEDQEFICKVINEV